MMELQAGNGMQEEQSIFPASKQEVQGYYFSNAFFR